LDKNAKVSSHINILELSLKTKLNSSLCNPALELYDKHESEGGKISSTLLDERERN
jgi:hypothetical protein